MNIFNMDKCAWFPHQFFDIASTYLPRDIQKTFTWCEYIYFNNGPVRSATERIAQYFITEIKTNQAKSNSDNLIKILNKNKKTFLLRAVDTLVYGNSFAIVYLPFDRVLLCPKCGFEARAAKIEYLFQKYEFHTTCKCGYRGRFNVEDRKNKNPEKINMVRIDPKTIVIDSSYFSGESEYYWKIPKEIIDQIGASGSSGASHFILNSMPMNILDAIKENKNFLFNSDKIDHMKNLSIAGVSTDWGFPLYLNIIKLSFYNTILRRANETIALDFCVPFRVLSPGHTASGDPLQLYNMGAFVSEMENMIQKHRVDPATIQITPFPIQYQAFGSEKKAIDLTMEIEKNNMEMMEGLNFPMEMYKNTLTAQSFPSMLRLFENTWEHLVSGLNDSLQWYANHICDFMGWERIPVSFTKVTLADDIEKKQLLLQLASAQQVSWDNALKPYNVNFLEEQENIAKQNREMQKITEDMQKKIMEDQQISEQPQGGGPSNPGDILAQASQIAQTFLTMPYEQRRVELMNLKQNYPLLHAAVSQVMDDIRSKSRSQSGQQAMMQSGLTGPMTNPQGQIMPPGQMIPPG